MVIVSYGVMKSASSYQYQIISELLHARHRSFEDYLDHREHLVGAEYASLYHDPSHTELKEILSRVPSSDFYTFKTHRVITDSNEIGDNGISNLIKASVQQDKLRVIGSIRDPRGILLSAIDHSKRTKADGTNDFFGSLNDLDSIIPHIQYAFKNAQIWHSSKNILWIPYDALFKFDIEIVVAIQDFIGIHFIDIFERLDKLKAKGSIHQFNKGIQQRWQTELNSEQQEKYYAIFKKEIDFYLNINDKMHDHFKNYSKYVRKKISNSVTEKKYYNITIPDNFDNT